MLRLTCPGVSRLAPLADQLPPIFLGGQTAAQGEAVKTSYRRSAPPAWQRGREGPLRSDAMRFKLRVINRETLSSAHLVSRQTDTAVIR